jgi:hypothetical protein
LPRTNCGNRDAQDDGLRDRRAGDGKHDPGDPEERPADRRRQKNREGIQVEPTLKNQRRDERAFERVGQRHDRNRLGASHRAMLSEGDRTGDEDARERADVRNRNEQPLENTKRERKRKAQPREAERAGDSDDRTVDDRADHVEP